MQASLKSAIESLLNLANELDIDADQVRTEAVNLAAAVSEPAIGAYLDWAEQLDRPADAEDFFEAAAKGRRYRVSPTPMMSQLANTSASKARQYAEALNKVIGAACSLGKPDSKVAGLAASAQQAQIQAVIPSPQAAGLDLPTDLGQRLQTSQERLAAMQEFSRVGDQVFSNVLEQMAINQQRLAELRNDSFLPGQLANPTPTSNQPTQPEQPAQQEQTKSEIDVEVDIAPADERSVDELLAELDSLIGLTEVKAEIKRQAAVLRVQSLREEAGLKVPTITRHLVFVGNPGTGKTTVARLVAGIYRALGLLSKGQLVEVDRSELVAGYLGQTAIKTAEHCDAAIGGVLFIDEAYGLSGDQYGEEAINTLVKAMEDNRNDLVVIVAGYPGPMKTFIAENPGLASRFRTTIYFDDYSDEELIDIFTLQASNADYQFAEDALPAFKLLLSRQIRDETFGNGRFCRNTLEAAIGHQAWRLKDIEQPSLEQLKTLLGEDILGDEVAEPGDELLSPGEGQ